jgi:hypothetical protein
MKIWVNLEEIWFPLHVQEEDNNSYQEDDGEVDDEDADTTSKNLGEIRHNYSTVSCQCDELYRFVLNDQTQLQSVFATITQMLDRLRQGSNISVYFLVDHDDNAVSQSAQSGGCLLGMERSITNANRMKCKQLGFNIWISKGRHVTTNYTETAETQPYLMWVTRITFPCPRQIHELVVCIGWRVILLVTVLYWLDMARLLWRKMIWFADSSCSRQAYLRLVPGTVATTASREPDL